MDEKNNDDKSKNGSQIREILPKNGLVYSEKGGLAEILCKPKILPLKSIVLEHNIPDDAISYDKGCYLGQELIARTHHQGVVRKKMMVYEIEEGNVNQGDELESKAGKVYSVMQNLCLVMVRESAFGKEILRTEKAAIKRFFSAVTLTQHRSRIKP